MMGDPRGSKVQLVQESQRLATFATLQNLQVNKEQLAKAGFIYTQQGNVVKCFSCNLELDLGVQELPMDVISFHKQQRRECTFAQGLQPTIRSKKFLTYDSLRFEKERLETFIDWPIAWLKPADLARDGFYFLRTADHCACVFCRGIVGAWEVGDTPRGEHKRHFPHCAFIRGQPVGNISITQSEVLSSLASTPESPPSCRLPSMDVDVCGTGRHMAGSYPEHQGTPAGTAKYEDMGLPQHLPPKRKDFLSKESRKASFVRWPELVKQKPDELAEAGFFYCGLSDHVRCFHCGNGLRNWEVDDDPWVEHARWYPECNYVLGKKGQEFVDKVRRERPPYLRTSAPAKPSSGVAKPQLRVTEAELAHLMDLDIIQGVLNMGFPRDKVQAALKKKLEQTGLPFFGLEPCIEAVLQYMEEETHHALREARGPNAVAAEATAEQGAKIASLQSQPSTSSNPSSAPAVVATPPTPTQPSTPATLSPASPPAVSQPSSMNSSPATLPAAASSEPQTSPEATSSSPAQSSMNLSPPGSGNPPLQMAASPSSSSFTTAPSTAPSTPSSNQGVEDMETEDSNTAQPMDIIREADKAIGRAERCLKPPISGPPSLEDKVKGKDQPEPEDTKEAVVAPSSSATELSPKNSVDLATELMRIRESRMCKVCMDAEMDVVFLPCQHMVTCASCALVLAQCPICRMDIKYTIKPIVS